MPEYDDRALYEKLVLDGFQAGLSWITILRKRENFRRAFDDFEPEKIARYTPKKIERLMQDAGIVRNRAKIEGAVRLGARLAQDHGKRPGIFRHAVGARRRQADRPQARQPLADAGRIRRIRGRCPRSFSAAASSSSARPSSMPSCRRSAWSTTIWWTATATRPCGKLAQAHDEQGAHKQRSRRAARLAAHAVGAAARPARSLAARRRDRGHRARARPRRALERADQGRAYLLGRPACRCWWRRWRAPRRRGSTPPARLAVLLHDAPEYVIGDMISPFKAVIGDSYKAVEHRLLAAIHLRFGLPADAAGNPENFDQVGRPRRRLSGGDAACRLRRPPRRAASSARRRNSPPRSSATI